MSATKHTPGPWYWNGTSLVSDRHGIYLMHTEEAPGLGYAAEANKRLIAAAPELFDLVLQYRDDLIRPPSPDSRERRLEAIDAALSKATPSLHEGERG